ncbi:hypothetical protein NPIL_48501 [Nephila pilipes]|uniref:Uncharacterized protein n=1 Tax=Nephila pilipes TaxID=299642 RepID=A0A8X6MBR8_NEPPI|nr:hypothetical protein NPIL_48501 [Nephila pilipes]
MIFSFVLKTSKRNDERSGSCRFPSDSGKNMDMGQMIQEEPSAKCARISLLQKQLECQEIRQIYFKSLINIEERDAQHAVTPQWKALDAERKQQEKDMKLAAGELTFSMPRPELHPQYKLRKSC